MNDPQFEKTLKDALQSTWDRIILSHDRVSLCHVNESVFRYFLTENLLKSKPLFSIESEWRKIDLLLNYRNEKQAAIEIKFYDCRVNRPIHGNPSYRGGASRQNLREFDNSLNNLRTLERNNWYEEQGMNITERYFILFGTRRPELGNRGDFERYYYPTPDALPTDAIWSKKSEKPDDMTCFCWLRKV